MILLKKLKPTQLKKLEKDCEYDLFEAKLQFMCSNFRKIIEKGIETELLSNVVVRHKMNISSLQLRYLYCITSEDIKIFDKMMTKYSFFEHSQSSEKPVSLPEINDIVADVDEMLNWLSGYNKRKN